MYFLLIHLEASKLYHFVPKVSLFMKKFFFCCMHKLHWKRREKEKFNVSFFHAAQKKILSLFSVCSSKTVVGNVVALVNKVL